MNVTVTQGEWRITLGGYAVSDFSTESGSVTVYFTNISANNGWFHLTGSSSFIGSVSNIVVKEVQGFEAPKVDTSGDLETEAYKLVEDTSNGEHKISSALTSFTSGNTYTYSVYVKAGERDWFLIDSQNPTNWSARAYFDLNNGTIGAVDFGTASITPLANGWYRCSVTGLSGATASSRIESIIAETDNDKNYTGDGTSGLYLAYAQFEESDYASSLMLPTTEGSTTSRVADACTGSGTAQDFKDYNASGVLYAEIAANSDDGTTSRYISINDGAFNDFIQLLYLNTSNTIRAQLYVGGVMQVRIDHVVTDTTVFHKTAFRWYGNTTTAADGRFSLWIDGAMVESEDVSGLTIASGTLTTMDFDYLNGTQNFYGKTRALEVLPYMSDTEMSLLTSP